MQLNLLLYCIMVACFIWWGVGFIAQSLGIAKVDTRYSKNTTLIFFHNNNKLLLEVHIPHKLYTY